MTWIVVAIAALAGVPLLLAIAGSLVPRRHVASSAARFRQSPATLFDAIADYASAPSWRTDLRAVERAPDRDGHAVWVEISKNGWRLPLEVLESTRPRRHVGRIADPSLPFGGQWTFEIETSDDASELTITEDGEIRNPIFRLLARLVFGYHATQRRYLIALGRKFGEDVMPRVIR
jgi:hypothetical protein